MISFDEFKKVELTVGRILSAEKVPDTDKLLKLLVDFGKKLPLNPPLKKEGEEIPPAEDSSAPLVGGDTTPAPAEAGGTPFVKGDRDIRQIVSGISANFPDPQALVGKKCMFVTNIPPRQIKGLESNGMVLAVSTDDGLFSLLEPNDSIPVGARAK